MSSHAMTTPVAETPTARFAGVARENNFDAIRLVAATMVLVYHAYPLTGSRSSFVSAFGVSLGDVGVLMFFSISGFLIVDSWRRKPHLGSFLLKRARRIFPGLAFVVIACALVLGPLVTTSALSDYFADPRTAGYVILNLLFQTTYVLPGVFDENPYPVAINGSLWTLEHEARAYVLIAAIGVVGLLRDRRVATIVLVGVLALETTSVAATEILGFRTLITGFLVGALLLLWRDRVRCSMPLAVASLAITIPLNHAVGGAAIQLAFIAAIGYATIALAYCTPPAWNSVLRGHDLSYGVYVWGFPVQQTIAWSWGDVGPIPMLIIAAPTVALLAWISWRLVERPALGRRRPSLTDGGLRAPVGGLAG